MDRFEKARAAGIDLQHDKVEYVTTCPQCSPTRRKKTVKCLSVKLSSDAILFICHHCGDKGGFFDDNSRTISGARTGASIPRSSA